MTAKIVRDAALDAQVARAAAALVELARGYLGHTADDSLRRAIESGALALDAFHEETLRALVRLALSDLVAFDEDPLPWLGAARLDGDRTRILRGARSALPSGDPDAIAVICERLLELHPRLDPSGYALQADDGPSHRAGAGHARRRSGTYYTPPALIDRLLDRALDPLLDDRVAGLDLPAAERALRTLAICDPACGAGRILLAAGRRVADRLARNRGAIDGRAPDAEAHARALRDVIEGCLYGVDRSPLAVDLCRAALAAAAGASCAPSSRIRVGDALLDAEPSPGFPWRARFEEVAVRGGFDAVLGNPPWIAYAGRAAQRLPVDVAARLRATFGAFAAYPTTHGPFVELAARLLRPGGRLGLVLPSSVAELDGYAPTRRAHDALCDVPAPLEDFGEGRFPGVTQPCLALASIRVEGGRASSPPGAPWPIARPDLDERGARLLARLAALPTLPASAFGERGFQSERAHAAHMIEAEAPSGRFTTPLREGGDVREFELGPPRRFADPSALGDRLRDEAVYRAVDLVIRQTARFPIAARSDGRPFRNSLLAGFGSEAWPADAVVALLNSALVRWHHWQRFRDARQPVLPQLKIGHLRAIPAPPAARADDVAALAALGDGLRRRNQGISDDERATLDALVARLYQLDEDERALVDDWHSRMTRTRGARV